MAGKHDRSYGACPRPPPPASFTISSRPSAGASGRQRRIIGAGLPHWKPGMQGRPASICCLTSDLWPMARMTHDRPGRRTPAGSHHRFGEVLVLGREAVAGAPRRRRCGATASTILMQRYEACSAAAPMHRPGLVPPPRTEQIAVGFGMPPRYSAGPGARCPSRAAARSLAAVGHQRKRTGTGAEGSSERLMSGQRRCASSAVRVTVGRRAARRRQRAFGAFAMTFTEDGAARSAYFVARPDPPGAVARLIYCLQTAAADAREPAPVGSIARGGGSATTSSTSPSAPARWHR